MYVHIGMDEDSIDSSEEEGDASFQETQPSDLLRELESAERSHDFWNVQKNVKYLRAGTATVTLLAIIGLKECGIQNEHTQKVLVATGGITILLNILRTSTLSCLIGTLQVLEMACRHSASKMAVHKAGGVQALQELLSHPDCEVKGLAAMVLARICCIPAARTNLIRNKGIPTLIGILQKGDNSFSWRTIEGAARVLWACSKSQEGRRDLLEGGMFDSIENLLLSSNEAVLIPIVGILHRCFRQQHIRAKIEKEGLITHIVKFMQSQSPCLQCLSVQAIARAALLDDTRTRLVEEGGLTVVVKLLFQESRSFINKQNFPPKHPARKVSIFLDSTTVDEPLKTGLENTCEKIEQTSGSVKLNLNPIPMEENKRKESSGAILTQEEALEYESEYTVMKSDLLQAVTAILWQVSKRNKHIRKLQELNAIPILVALLNHSHEKVLTNVAGTISEAAMSPECCQVVVEGEGIARFLELLQSSYDPLLLNVTKALGSCALHDEALDQILAKEGLRFLWSHLKSTNQKIQASAANAICICLQQKKEGLAEVVRSLVGGIELLVALLESPCEAVLSAVCAAIARIASDPQNLAIMTDYGAVTCLSKLAVRENDSLRPYLAEAIAACCVSRETGLLFGQAGAVAPLVKYLETNDSNIRRPTCRALHRLSLEPENCITLHQSGAVQLLLEMLGSTDEVVQEAAADCLRNIRLLALQCCRRRDTSDNIFSLKPKHISKRI